MHEKLSKYIQIKILDYHPAKEGSCKFLCVMPGVGTAQGEYEFLLPPSLLISIQQLEVLAVTSSCSSGASWWDVHSACWMEKRCLRRPHNLPVSLQPFLWAAPLPCHDSVCRAEGGGGRSLSSTKPDFCVPSRTQAAPSSRSTAKLSGQAGSAEGCKQQG